MNWIIYLGFALLALEIDAIACEITKKKLNLIPALAAAALWPIISVLVIFVIWRNNKGEL